jgi:hypothetical protein
LLHPDVKPDITGNVRNEDSAKPRNSTVYPRTPPQHKGKVSPYKFDTIFTFTQKHYYTAFKRKKRRKKTLLVGPNVAKRYLPGERRGWK